MDTNHRLPICRAKPLSPSILLARTLEGATVQANVTGEVHGELKQTLVVEAGEYLKALVQKMENGIKLIGSLSNNGPGSTGKSSPDASAPAVGFNGVPW